MTLSQHSAGGVLVREAGAPQALLIKNRASDVFELPKGRLEPGETEPQAALRELAEETGLLLGSAQLTVGRELGTLQYNFENRRGNMVQKQVRYFLLRAQGPLLFGPLPKTTGARAWLDQGQLSSIALAHEDLRAIILDALGALS